MISQKFAKYYPFCSALIDPKTPNEDKAKSLEALKIMVKNSPRDEIQILSEHLIFPAQIYLDTPNRKGNFTLDILDYLSQVLSKIQLEQKIVAKILDQILRLYSNDESEDLKISGLKTIDALFESANQEILTDFYESKNCKLLLGQLTFEILNWINDEKLWKVDKLMQTSLRVLNVIIHEKGLAFYRVFRDLLPGTLSKLMKFVKDGNSPLKWKHLALAVWAKFVTHFVNDKVLENLDSVEFSREWINLAQDHIFNQCQILASFSLFISDSDENLLKIKHSLLNVTIEVRKKSLKILKNLSLLMIDILSCLSIDVENEEISFSAQLELEFWIQNFEDKENLAQNCREKFFEICHHGSSGVNLTKVHSLLVLLRQLEHPVFFTSQTHVQNFVRFLLKFCQMENFAQIEENIEFDRIFDANFNFLIERKKVKKRMLIATLQGEQRFMSIIKLTSEFQSIFRYLIEDENLTSNSKILLSDFYRVIRVNEQIFDITQDLLEKMLKDGEEERNYPVMKVHNDNEEGIIVFMEILDHLVMNVWSVSPQNLLLWTLPVACDDGRLS